MGAGQAALTDLRCHLALQAHASHLQQHRRVQAVDQEAKQEDLERRRDGLIWKVANHGAHGHPLGVEPDL